MFDIVCILFLYFMFMLDILGIEKILIFKIVTIICLIKLVITLLEKICGITADKKPVLTHFNVLLRSVICIGAFLPCLVFTFASSIKIKIVFIVFVLVIALLTKTLKRSDFKIVLLILLSTFYGIVLAKWYQGNPLEKGFGNNTFFESVGIVLSAMILPFSFYVIKKRGEEET